MCWNFTTPKAPFYGYIYRRTVVNRLRKDFTEYSVFII